MDQIKLQKFNIDYVEFVTKPPLLIQSDTVTYRAVLFLCNASSASDHARMYPEVTVILQFCVSLAM